MAIEILNVAPLGLPALLPALGRLLHACVADGASVGFVQPFGPADAEAFFKYRVQPGLQAGSRLLWVVSAGDEVAGSVQLDLDTPPNQAHRAEVAKLLVHPAHRGRGLADALMRTLEAAARARGRELLTFDTRTGDRGERVYTRLGYLQAGVIPGYARDPASGRRDATTCMYKLLS